MDAAFLGSLYSPPTFADADVNAYITAVEQADGGGGGSVPVMLETAVRNAMNTYVLALKATTGWAAMDVILPLIGARTLAGSLVPLKGSAPTLNNFVAGDYDRKLGLKGDGINKGGTVSRSISGRTRDNVHLSFYADATVGASTNVYAGIDFVIGAATQIFTSGGFIAFCAANSSMSNPPATSILPEFLGIARNSTVSTAEVWTSSVATETGTVVPGVADATIGLFCQYDNATTVLRYYTPSRLSNITWGPYYNQPMQVRTAVLNFRTALAAAIP